ncbi:MAG: PorV/PorQ family protein [candidate division WOR-3 bacterium]
MRSLAAGLLIVASALAGPEGFASLKVLPGTRECGMGGVGVASAFGPQAVAWNPAATASVPVFAASVNYVKWILDTHHQSLFLVRNLKRLNIGLGLASFSAGRFEFREDVPTEEPVGWFAPTDFTGYLNVATALGPKGELGVTGRYFYSKIMTYQAAGPGLDLGMRLRPVKGLVVGASVVDFGKWLSYHRDPFWLPTRGRLGVCYELPFGENRLILACDGSYFFFSRTAGFQAGTEFQLGRILALRAGYDLLARANHLNFGFGLNIGDFRIDYSLAPLCYDLGAAHRLSLGFGY